MLRKKPGIFTRNITTEIADRYSKGESALFGCLSWNVCSVLALVITPLVVLIGIVVLAVCYILDWVTFLIPRNRTCS